MRTQFQSVVARYELFESTIRAEDRDDWNGWTIIVQQILSRTLQNWVIRCSVGEDGAALTMARNMITGYTSAAAYFGDVLQGE